MLHFENIRIFPVIENAFQHCRHVPFSNAAVHNSMTASVTGEQPNIQHLEQPNIWNQKYVMSTTLSFLCPITLYWL